MQKQVIDLLQSRGSTFTGLTVLSRTDIAVQSEAHVFVLRFAARWATHHAWPRAFQRAACTLMAISKFGKQHARSDAVADAGLWSLPSDVLHHIIELAAGEHAEWLEVGADRGATAMSSTYQGLSEEVLLHPMVQKPLCQLRFASSGDSDVGLRLFDVALPPCRPYMT